MLYHLLGDNNSLLTEIDTALVVDMNDGGMGSIRFHSESQDLKQRQLSHQIAEAKFLDSDGIESFISINLDCEGKLFEIDIWKADFSSLRRYPGPLDFLPV